MKFTDGFWRNREGLEVYNAAEVYEAELSEDSITAVVPHFHVENRGMTLTGPVFTLRLSSPLPDVIRVQVWHFTGGKDPSPCFELPAEGAKGVVLTQDEEAYCLRSGSLTARLSRKNGWALDFSSAGRPLTNSRWKNLGYVKDGDKAYMKEQLALSVGELVYGLGERFTPFAKNGQVVEMWNADGGTSSELSYKNIPFYMTNKGYGVFVNDPGAVSFEVASEKVSRVQFSVPGECLDYYVINGPEPKKVLERYTDLTGKSGLPPAWSFGLWLTTSFVTTYDEKTVSSFIDGMAERGIPLHVFHFDCFWMKEYTWTNLEWDRRQFPDPEGYLKKLKARGLKICVWINSYIAQRSVLFEEGKKKGYLLKKTNGDVWQTDTWQPGMGMVDFTNPEARDWFASKLGKLVDMGVDCFKTDFGERIPTEDVAWFDGSDPLKAHNFYTHLYNQTVFELLEKKLGKGKAMVFARSATAGGQKYPVHWGGDCSASYESMAESLRGGLSLCASGFGFWSHDISGFEHTATADLYKRWSAFGLLSTHSRLHGNASYRVPWLFDEEAVDVLRFFTKLKCSLMPYVYAQARDAHVLGHPVMRAMFLEFPEDPTCAFLDRQYMLGPSLLVAPVFSESGEVEYYLPSGGWTNLISGARVQGGRWVKERHDYKSLPLMVRDGSLIAYGAEDGRPDYEYARDARLELFGLAEGETAVCKVYAEGGALALEVSVRSAGGRYYVESKGGKNWTLVLRGMDKAEPDSGAKVAPGPNGVVVTPARHSGAFTLTRG
jgi:alpha-D-xyloside xylohydrolase